MRSRVLYHIGEIFTLFSLCGGGFGHPHEISRPKADTTARQKKTPLDCKSCNKSWGFVVSCKYAQLLNTVACLIDPFKILNWRTEAQVILFIDLSLQFKCCIVFVFQWFLVFYKCMVSLKPNTQSTLKQLGRFRTIET